MLDKLTRLANGKTGRCSSWDTTGRNQDFWRIEPGQTFVDLGRTAALLPAAEQVRIERYRIGQRLKVNILEVVRTNKGPRVVLSNLPVARSPLLLPMMERTQALQTQPVILPSTPATATWL